MWVCTKRKSAKTAGSGEKVTDSYEIDQSVIDEEEKYYQPKELNKKIKKISR